MKRRSGFALLVTVALIGIVTVTVASIGAASYMQLTRTRWAGEEAQLRQLLLAGTQAAHAKLAASRDIDGALQLPDSLNQDNATLNLHSQDKSADQATIEIDATLGKRNLSQRVHFTHNGTSWLVDGADLGA